MDWFMWIQLDCWFVVHEMVGKKVVWLGFAVSGILSFEIFPLLYGSSNFYFAFDLPLFVLFFSFEQMLLRPEHVDAVLTVVKI